METVEIADANLIHLGRTCFPKLNQFPGKQTSESKTILVGRDHIVNQFLFLIGFRATGKTTVGKRLALKTNSVWRDSDAFIESTSGRTIPQIFTELGEPGFREIESRAIADLISELAETPHAVISLGGGALLSNTNRSLIKLTGKSIWLDASANCLAERIIQSQTENPRPALTRLSPHEEVTKLLAERRDVYSDCADYTINTEQLSIEETVDLIAQWWQSVDK